MSVTHSIYATLFACSAILLASCSSSDEETATTTISGSVFAAAVEGASLSVNDIQGNLIAGPVVTDINGGYTLSVPTANLAQPLVFESRGGTFIDEATSVSSAAGLMAVYAEANSLQAGSRLHATAESTIIQHMIMQQNMTKSAAENAYKNAFGYVPDVSIAPTNATSPASDSEEQEKIAGLHAATFSQLTMELGFAPAAQFELLQAIAQDLSDDELNGEDAQGDVIIASQILPADIQNRYVVAMMNFRDTANDATGLANDKLGGLPFSRVALTENYRLEYSAGMMQNIEGQSTFKLRITRRDNDQPAAGLALSLMPMMHMATHDHSTPIGDIVDNGDGSYDVTTYYLMPSVMMDGTSMGYWELKVMIGGMMGESARFYPEIMMAMGDTAKVVLKGSDSTDVIAGMLGDESRNYFIFNTGLEGIDNDHDFQMFVAAKESMMSFPAIDTGVQLNAGTAYELNVSSVSVEVSVDDGGTWVAASNEGGGNFTASGLTSMSSGVEAQLKLRLHINGEQKTTNGMTAAGDGSNDYGSFTVSPD